jgi:hypothetical protein
MKPEVTLRNVQVSIQPLGNIYLVGDIIRQGAQFEELLGQHRSLSNCFCVYLSLLHELRCEAIGSGLCHLAGFPNVAPLVLQVYFRVHKGSLDNPNMDTQSELMKYHSDLPIGSTFQICAPLGKIFITLPLNQ